MNLDDFDFASVPQDSGFTTGDQALAAWWADLESGTPPVRYQLGRGFDGVAVGPGLVTVVGGAPGAGKTALVNQWVTDASRLDPDLRVLTCNVEMSPAALLDRQLARLSGVDLGSIRGRVLDDDRRERVGAALPVLEDVMSRTAFLTPPFTMQNIAAAYDETVSDLIVLDYLQRIRPPGDHRDTRGAVSEVMDFARRFADAGAAVVAVAAVARGKGEKGSSYNDLSLASFRESSEIEYGADDAFILTGRAGTPERTLKHLKSRHGEPRDIPLHFAGTHQSFSSVDRAAPERAGAKVNLSSIPGLAERLAAARLEVQGGGRGDNDISQTDTVNQDPQDAD